MITIRHGGWSAVGLILAACAVPGSDPPVGERQDEIQGGVQEFGYPELGYIGGIGCTGALIAPDYVLTARHCDAPTLTFNPGNTPAEWQRQPHATDRHILHPSRDLMLLHLTTPITTIAPEPFNVFGLPAVGSICTVVGYGDHFNAPTNTTVDGFKFSATVRVESASAGTIGVVMVSGISDFGDSGGPLICNGVSVGVTRDKSDGTWPQHVRSNYTPIDQAWIRTNAQICGQPSWSCSSDSDCCGGSYCDGGSCQPGCAPQDLTCRGVCGQAANRCGQVFDCDGTAPCWPSCPPGSWCGQGDGCGGSCRGACWNDPGGGNCWWDSDAYCGDNYVGSNFFCR